MNFDGQRLKKIHFYIDMQLNTCIFDKYRKTLVTFFPFQTEQK